MRLSRSLGSLDERLKSRSRGAPRRRISSPARPWNARLRAAEGPLQGRWPAAQAPQQVEPYGYVRGKRQGEGPRTRATHEVERMAESAASAAERPRPRTSDFRLT